MSDQTLTLLFLTDAVHNLNKRYHWAPEAKIIADARKCAAGAAARQLTPMQRASLAVTIGYPDKRGRDRSNYAKHVKACVDGIVGDAGILPNDSDAFLLDGGTTTHVTGERGVFVFGFTFAAIA